MRTDNLKWYCWPFFHFVFVILKTIFHVRWWCDSDNACVPELTEYATVAGMFDDGACFPMSDLIRSHSRQMHTVFYIFSFASLFYCAAAFCLHSSVTPAVARTCTVSVDLRASFLLYHFTSSGRRWCDAIKVETIIVWILWNTANAVDNITRAETYMFNKSKMPIMQTKKKMRFAPAWIEAPRVWTEVTSLILSCQSIRSLHVRILFSKVFCAIYCNCVYKSKIIGTQNQKSKTQTNQKTKNRSTKTQKVGRFFFVCLPCIVGISQVQRAVHRAP